MNRDEILNLPAGQVIDELVAVHVMGWSKLEELGFWHWVDADDHFMCGVGRYDGFEDGEDFHVLKWHPSESMLWAWEVVEKSGIGMLNKVHGQWEAYCGNIRGVSESVPLAICKAALLVAYKEVE